MLIALRVYRYQWAAKHIIMDIDNQTVVNSLKFYKIRDPFLQAAAGSISATYDITLSYEYIKAHLMNIKCSQDYFGIMLVCTRNCVLTGSLNLSGKLFTQVYFTLIIPSNYR